MEGNGTRHHFDAPAEWLCEVELRPQFWQNPSRPITSVPQSGIPQNVWRIVFHDGCFVTLRLGASHRPLKLCSEHRFDSPSYLAFEKTRWCSAWLFFSQNDTSLTTQGDSIGSLGLELEPDIGLYNTHGLVLGKGEKSRTSAESLISSSAHSGTMSD